MTVNHLNKYWFVKPMTFTIEEVSDGYILSNEESNLVAYGVTVKEALDELYYSLDFDWEDIAMADDSELSPAAIEHKKWLNSNITVRE